ncbi:hypothetical protein [Leptolyngbya sp. Heron Island J]|uniref:hypothetical protein n=1 Tax=Leptolyngbya sp. Heron Island J TaxID=1385935 RepID=UPI001F27239D|nr:hypothetical protein [Leptolyngbya sp. Heron Island J]
MQSSTDQNLNSYNNKEKSFNRITSLWSSIKAGLIYFVTVFGVGFGLGVIRVVWIEPQLGARLAELLEMPLMLVAVVVAAYWVVKRLAVPPVLWSRLSMGLVALVCLLCAEWGLVLGLRGLSMTEYIATRDPIAGTVYYIMLCLFAVMPWLIARKDSQAPPSSSNPT